MLTTVGGETNGRHDRPGRGCVDRLHIFARDRLRALGGLAQALIGQPGQSSLGQMGSRSTRAFIGGVTAVLVVGALSQIAVLDAVNELFKAAEAAEAAEAADKFQSLLLIVSVSLAAGFWGQTLLYRVTERLLSGFNLRLKETEEKVALERKIHEVDRAISSAVSDVREGYRKRSIELLKPILSDSEVPARSVARAHGVTANAKKMIALLNEAVDHVSVAHRLLPDDYRFVFNRACYLGLISPDNIDKVLQDLRQAIAKGLSFDQIKRDKDLETLREHERYKAFEDEFNRREGIANCGE